MSKKNLASDGPLIHEVFSQRVRERGSSIAVEASDGRLSYTELDDMSNAMAHYLLSLGIKPGHALGICLPRGYLAVVSMLTCLKLGVAYVPFDPNYPKARLDLMAEDASLSGVLTLSTGMPPIGNVRRIALDNLEAHIAAQPTFAPHVTVSPDAVAYCLYTSGSTGRPKGVLISHRALAISMRGLTEYYGTFGRLLMVPSFSFDASVSGIFGPLLAKGASTVLIADQSALDDLDILTNVLLTKQVDTLLCVPSLLEAILDVSDEFGRGPSKLTVIVGGEVCPVSLVTRVREDAPHINLFNEYGPTEATIRATVYACSQDRDREPLPIIPIGSQVASVRIYLLGDAGDPVEPGTLGEIYIGGSAVANAYHRRAALTANAFRPDPFGQPGSRMYRTGDLGQQMPNGDLLFIGRKDRQVEVNGHRIELEEIEHHLMRLPGIREACAVFTGFNGTNAVLQAFVVGASNTTAPSAADLKEELGTRLPQWMIPAVIRIKRALPRTPNGKTDVSALMLEAATPPDLDTPWHFPEDALETQLVAIWKDVTTVHEAKVDDDIFMLGGNSLTAARVVSRVRAVAGLAIRIRDVFNFPTPRKLAAHIRTLS